MVIGALGVLDDVTISQSSTVLALHGANPSLTFGELFSRAMTVGRDHVSATVNTLVLAYVGAALPVLLIFSSGELGVLDAVNVELVAKEVVAMLVGSIGLIAAVPITTALAALLSRRSRPRSWPRCTPTPTSSAPAPHQPQFRACASPPKPTTPCGPPSSLRPTRRSARSRAS